MKRNPIIFLVLVLVLALSITSCELLDEMEYGDGTDIDNDTIEFSPLQVSKLLAAIAM